MDILSQEQLDQILSDHALFLALDPLGIQASFAGMDCRGLAFGSTDLSQADMRFADFTGANLSGAILPDQSLMVGSQF